MRSDRHKNKKRYKRGSSTTKKRKRPAAGKKRSRKVIVLLLVLAIVIVSYGAYRTYWKMTLSSADTPSWVVEKYLDVDGHSRTGLSLSRPTNIVVHYVANPGSTGWDNWDYFNSPQSVTSSHYIIGLDGTVIQCVPLDEQSSASNSRNDDSISIECCHPDSTGEFSSETYTSLIRLLTWLCNKTGLEGDDIIRHYDITRKNCPKYYVEHPDAWIKLVDDVKSNL